jgi:antitoxin component YwqK of YwqJK toxin-antitoxin module
MTRIDIMDPDVDLDMAQRYTYRGELYTGEAVEFGPNGKIVGLWTIENGLKDGPQKGWYADGTLESEGVSRRGLPIGQWRDWHPNGKLKTLSLFNDSGELLSVREWAPDGTELPPSTPR